MENQMKGSDIIGHRKLMEATIVKEHQKMFESWSKYFKAKAERIAMISDLNLTKEEPVNKMKNMKTLFYGNGDEYEYDHDRFLKFYNEYEETFKDPCHKLPVDVVLLQWVKAHGKPVKPQPQIKEGDFVVRFINGVFQNGIYVGEKSELLKYISSKRGPCLDYEKDIRRFVCPTDSVYLQEPGLEVETPIVPRTIEEAERFCTEVTGVKPVNTHYVVLRRGENPVQYHMKEVRADSITEAIEAAFSREEIESGNKIIAGEIGAGFAAYRQSLREEFNA